MTSNSTLPIGRPDPQEVKRLIEELETAQRDYGTMLADSNENCRVYWQAALEARAALYKYLGIDQ